MKKLLAFLLIAMITCEVAFEKDEILKFIKITLQDIYNALEKLGVIQKLKEIIEQGKKEVVKLCCKWVSESQCKEFCPKIYGILLIN